MYTIYDSKIVRVRSIQHRVQYVYIWKCNLVAHYGVWLLGHFITEFLRNKSKKKKTKTYNKNNGEHYIYALVTDKWPDRQKIAGQAFSANNAIAHSQSSVDSQRIVHSVFILN